jgi:hypothetical protein
LHVRRLNFLRSGNHSDSDSWALDQTSDFDEAEAPVQRVRAAIDVKHVEAHRLALTSCLVEYTASAATPCAPASRRRCASCVSKNADITISSVSRRAGVTRKSIYRREDLVALIRAHRPVAAVPDDSPLPADTETSIVAALRARLTAKDTQIAQLKAALRERDRTIAALHGELEKRGGRTGTTVT